MNIERRTSNDEFKIDDRNELKRRKGEGGNRRTEERGQKTEDRRQKTEDRRQKTEDRRQKTDPPLIAGRISQTSLNHP
jgi:hypothetical protein